MSSPLVQLMAQEPGSVAPSVLEPASNATSLPGRLQAPPLTRSVGLASMIFLPTRQTLGLPADSVRCKVFDNPSGMYANFTAWALEISPSAALSTSPKVKRRQSV